MSSFLMELWSTEKSYTVQFKEISLCLSFVQSFDTLPKQKLYKLTLSFALCYPLFYLRASSSYYHCNANLSKILYLLY